MPVFNFLTTLFSSHTYDLVSLFLLHRWRSGHNFEPTVEHYSPVLEGQQHVWGDPLRIRKGFPLSKPTPAVREREDSRK